MSVRHSCWWMVLQTIKQGEKEWKTKRDYAKKGAGFSFSVSIVSPLPPVSELQIHSTIYLHSQHHMQLRNNQSPHCNHTVLSWCPINIRIAKIVVSNQTQMCHFSVINGSVVCFFLHIHSSRLVCFWVVFCVVGNYLVWCECMVF